MVAELEACPEADQWGDASAAKWWTEHPSPSTQRNRADSLMGFVDTLPFRPLGSSVRSALGHGAVLTTSFIRGSCRPPILMMEPAENGTLDDVWSGGAVVRRRRRSTLPHQLEALAVPAKDGALPRRER